MGFKKKVVSVVMSFMMAVTPILCVSAQNKNSDNPEIYQTAADQGINKESTVWYLAIQAARMWIGLNMFKLSIVYAFSGAVANLDAATTGIDVALGSVAVVAAISGIAMFYAGLYLLLGGAINTYYSIV